MSSVIGSITIPTPALKVKLMTQKFLKIDPWKVHILCLKKHKFIWSNYCSDIKYFEKMTKLSDLYVSVHPFCFICGNT